MATESLRSVAKAEPKWAHVHYPPINFQTFLLLGAESQADGPRSRTRSTGFCTLMRSWGYLCTNRRPLRIRARPAAIGTPAGANVAVDVVFDSVSIATTFKETLAEAGVIFCPISKPCYPSRTRSKVLARSFRSATTTAALNSAVFATVPYLYSQGRPLSDGAIDVLSYQQKNRPVGANLIIADEGSHVSYLSCRSCVTKISCTRRRGACCLRRRPDQIFDGAKLVPRR